MATMKKLKLVLGNTTVAFTVLGGYVLGVQNERHFPGDRGFSDVFGGELRGEVWYLIALVVLAIVTPYLARAVLPPWKETRDDPSRRAGPCA